MYMVLLGGLVLPSSYIQEDTFSCGMADMFLDLI